MDIRRHVMIERVDPTTTGNGTPSGKEPDPELGYEVIPAERYTSKEFMALEWEHVWT